MIFLPMPHFNPRARVGRDCKPLRPERRHEISIHAPAWGATPVRLRWELTGLFQSTRPRGARRQPWKELHSHWEFQSTRPRGARRVRGSSGAAGIDFNPRARVGRDRGKNDEAAAEDVFQSTRPRGARQRKSRSGCARCHFNPRARVGRDSCLFRLPPRCSDFNPRARVGRDVLHGA